MPDKIVCSPMLPDDLRVRSESFSRTLWTALEKHGHKLKLAMEEVLTGDRASYRELMSRAGHVASRLLMLGCRRGDVVALFSPNSIAWIVVYLAVCRLGAIPAAINALLTVGELRHQLKTCEAKFVFTTQDLANTALDASTELAAVHTVLLSRSVYAGCVDIESTAAAEQLPPLPSVDVMDARPGDINCILFSSGTTGLHKAIELSHRSVQHQMSLILHPKIAPVVGPHTLSFAPFAHVVGIFPCLASFVVGWTVHVMSRFDFQLFLRAIEQYKISTMLIVPPVATLLVKSPVALKYDLSNLKDLIIGSSCVSSEVENLLKERYPWIVVRQVYGLTETCAAVGATPYQDENRRTFIVKSGSIGVPLLGVQMKVMDIETGETLGPRRTGEIWIKSELIMAGYVNNHQATRDAIDNDGWLRSGDIGYYDEDGYFYVVDRLKELIKYNAHQVPPAELEAVLLSHPDVADAGVVGLRDAEHGELPLAWVVKKQNSTITEMQLQQFVDAKVAPFKKLRGGVHFVAAIPRTASGKILRRVIKEQLTKQKL